MSNNGGPASNTSHRFRLWNGPRYVWDGVETGVVDKVGGCAINLASSGFILPSHQSFIAVSSRKNPLRLTILTQCFSPLVLVGGDRYP